MPEEPVFLNYTRRKVRIRIPISDWFDGKEFVEFAPVAEWQGDPFPVQFPLIGSLSGINFSVREMDESFLPAETDNTYLIVPAYVAEHPSLAHREDLVSVGPRIENENGECVAYNGLTAGVGLSRREDRFYIPISM